MFSDFKTENYVIFAFMKFIEVSKKVLILLSTLIFRHAQVDQVNVPTCQTSAGYNSQSIRQCIIELFVFHLP